MNDAGLVAMSAVSQRFAAAFYAAAALIALGLADAMIRLAAASDWERLSSFGVPAFVAVLMALDYLFWSACDAWQAARRLRAGERLTRSEAWLAALGHLLVLGLVLVVLRRGGDSQGLMVGLDRLLVTLGVSALLLLALLVAGWVAGQAGGEANVRATRAALRLLTASVCAVAAWTWLEMTRGS